MRDIRVDNFFFAFCSCCKMLIQDLFELSCEYIEYFTLRVRSTKTSVKSWKHSRNKTRGACLKCGKSTKRKRKAECAGMPSRRRNWISILRKDKALMASSGAKCLIIIGHNLLAEPDYGSVSQTWIHLWTILYGHFPPLRFACKNKPLLLDPEHLISCIFHQICYAIK